MNLRIDGLLARAGVRAIIVCACVSAFPAAATAATGCAPVRTAPGQVVMVMEKLFAALHEDTPDHFQQLTTPGFYAYDGGKRFDAAGIFELNDP